MQVTDQKLEIAIGRMLQTGVFLSAAIVLLGGILFLYQSSGPHADYTQFHGVAEALRSPSAIAVGAFHGDAASIIQLGLLVLIATPIARVALAGAGFLLERDQLYFWISLIVFIVLIFSLLHAG
jgi:uncharacterized membrane protein